MKPKIVLITGAPHGGTTILNMVLGQHPAIFATGKLRDFPAGGLFTENNVCSCGQRANRCSFWNQVRQRYLPHEDKSDRERLPELFRIIAELSGREFTGDVTHNVDYGRKLLNLSGVETYLVNIVRDGRAVVYSRIRKDQRIARLGASRWRHFRRVVQVSRRWAAQRRQFIQMEKELGDRAVRVSYEQLCSHPETALENIGASLRLDFSTIGKRLAERKPLEPLSHLIRGNEILRASSSIVLRHDLAWLEQMSALDRATFRIASRLG